jgi:hypothetical protein
MQSKLPAKKQWTVDIYMHGMTEQVQSDMNIDLVSRKLD